jgi:ComF family protein
LPGARAWGEAFLGLFYPEVCQVCEQERATAVEGYLCRSCREGPGGVRFIVPPFCQKCGLPFAGDISEPFACANCGELELAFDFARSAVAAQGVVLDVIHRYKYHHALWFEPFLSQLLITAATPTLTGAPWDLVVPVPLHTLRQREREFNQAERLGRRLAEAIGVPLNTRVLRRVKQTQTQTMLSRPQRHQNMEGAFQVESGGLPDGARVVLVDDVLTTGSTTSACAGALRQAGASCVGVWTLARGLTQ